MVLPNVPVLKPGSVILSFAQVQWSRLNTIAGNLSNAHTPGFKELILKAQEVPYALKDGQSVSYVQAAEIIRNTQEGPLRITENPLDVAIIGKGYFGVQTASGLRYTRNGQMRVRGDGVLVGPSNDPVVSQDGGKIVIPEKVKNIRVGMNGAVESELGIIGHIGVFDFINEQKLKDVGNSLYQTDEAGLESKNFEIISGSLEDANVNSADMALQMMQTTRLYEQAQTLSKADDERLKSILNLSPKAA